MIDVLVIGAGPAGISAAIVISFYLALIFKPKD